MKKSEILEAIQRELACKQQNIRKIQENAAAAADWKKEPLKRQVLNYAWEIRGIASVLRRLGFIDWDQMESMYEEARKAAEAVGKELGDETF